MSYAFIQINMVVDDVLDIVGNLRLVYCVDNCVDFFTYSVYTLYIHDVMCPVILFVWTLYSVRLSGYFKS